MSTRPKPMTMAEFLERDPAQDCEQIRAYLEANLHPEGHGEVEDRIKSILPGDEEAYEAHPAYVPPNPWMDRAGWSFSKLKRMMEAGQVPDSEYQTAMAALSILADGGSFLPPGVQPEEPPPDVPQEPRVYSEDLSGDYDIYDPSGNLWASPVYTVPKDE